MAKFVFKLKSVLNVKLNFERQAKAEFAIAIRKLQSEEEKLERIYADMESYQDKIRSTGNSTLNIAELKRYTEAVNIKKEQAEEQQKVVETALKAYEAARLKLNNTIKERKTYEALRDKAFEDFKHEIEEAERKETDELVSYRFSLSDGAAQADF